MPLGKGRWAVGERFCTAPLVTQLELEALWAPSVTPQMRAVVSRASLCSVPVSVLCSCRFAEGHSEEHVVWLRLPAAQPVQQEHHCCVPGHGCL